MKLFGPRNKFSGILLLLFLCMLLWNVKASSVRVSALQGGETTTATQTATEDNSDAGEVPPQRQATPTTSAPEADQESQTLPKPETAKDQDYPAPEPVSGEYVPDEVIVRFKA
ncbi:MAG: hypothetical protein AB8I58_18215, partial [Anaerolineales bacterium]